MFENLSARLAKTMKTLRGQARLTESNTSDMLREIRLALLEADVALAVVKELLEKIKSYAFGQEVMLSLTPGQALVNIVKSELVKAMGKISQLNLNTRPPVIILLTGLQGTGKTSTAGKLAKWLKEQEKKKVLTVSCDVYRPAAIAQLQAVSAQAQVDCFPSTVDQNPIDIAAAAAAWAKNHHYQVLIVDTAGRLGIDEKMMEEISQIHKVLDPIETLFVVDAMQGQDAINTATAFGKAVSLSGIILTKVDGDSRGGAALSVRHITGQPIKFLGTGEKLNALELFDPERLASRILGMGDILALVSEAQKNINTVATKKLAKKIQKGQFDLNDFQMQLGQMKNIGGVTGLLDKLPMHMLPKSPATSEVNDAQIKRAIGIIDSMTPVERRQPELLKASRKRRIALGSGVAVQEVNKMLAQFEQMQQMMKKFKSGGFMRAIGSMRGAFKGRL